MNIVCNTPLQVLYKTYDGKTPRWVQYTEDLDGEMISVFFCQWKNYFGTEAIKANATGIMQPARVRIPYIPALYSILIQKETIIVRGAEATDLIDGVPDYKNPNLYVLTSNVDNINDESRLLEFSVKRYERK